ncbi:MAG: hypothetical protein JGK24_21595 [Microcoleus sp. PH2017_29_MFU_D_A]|nr:MULTISPECIES: hypothetical protein [unclassified Microcoleus]MCC3438256.1 hypothetical protein [Microcoleus sp. PH2017_05_CCC_O_A]MCC3467114.1 hypothetical protein [Microcoleus sp. PH2017_06_SFM_O_A]MCC3505978.1 hypothetical protein [Microcoleus sp. PH2017_19_SFW_U_A]MCC3509716.1 hypothetical protein [Microcoleus sp. PH2017_17_BER_D_A]MCC3457268.1 hypothetical protein [Microcoleus sp. PH2017_08_TRC_O_A]
MRVDMVPIALLLNLKSAIDLFPNPVYNCSGSMPIDRSLSNLIHLG